MTYSNKLHVFPSKCVPDETAQSKELAGEEGGGLQLLEVQRLQRFCSRNHSSNQMQAAINVAVEQCCSGTGRVPTFALGEALTEEGRQQAKHWTKNLKQG